MPQNSCMGISSDIYQNVITVERKIDVFRSKTQTVNSFILTVLLAIMLAITVPGYISQALGVDLLSSYEILKDSNYNDFIKPLLDGGASEDQIEAFLVDLDTEVNEQGPVNEANFNSIMYNALQDVITRRVHYDVFMALNTSFEEEISYTVANGELHPNLVPLRNAVKEVVLGNDGSSAGSGSGGGGGGALATNSSLSEVGQQINSQLAENSNQVSLDINSSGQLSITDEQIEQIQDANRDLELTWEGGKFIIPAISLDSVEGSLAVNVAPLNQTDTDEILENASSVFLKLVGDVYELQLSSDASVNGIIFFDPITVTFSYQEENLDGINENTLDVFYYDETSGKWQKMNGELDVANNTVSFYTTHCSKYAVMSYDPPEADPVQVNFTDLTNHWAESDIKEMVTYGLIKGVSQNEFAPEKRGQMIGKYCLI